MEYIRTDGKFPRFSKTAVTIGKFDGIHRGHRKLISHIVERKKTGAEAVVFAFDLNSPMIFSHDERAAMLENMGVDVLVECSLNERIRKIRAEEFVRDILVGSFHADLIAVGEDNRFGFERKGTPELLTGLGQKYGFETVVQPSEMDGDRKISSTRVRKELLSGRMEKVASLMGTPYYISGTVLHGIGLGHVQLLPTVNLIPGQDKQLPPKGVYFTRTLCENGCRYGITNIGNRPTVGGTFTSVETYLFDCSEDLYGKQLTVMFDHFKRPEKKFSSLELLKEQMMKDAEDGKDYYRSYGGKLP